ncbi:hypothetical protein ACQ23P_06440 [Staphylococcus cohnii]|nr:hypothetical protein [Staphylococcus sp. GDY8P94P]
MSERLQAQAPQASIHGQNRILFLYQKVQFFITYDFWLIHVINFIK